MQKTEIREKYRELRKSGKNTHAKGGGIGIYEIGKISEEINYKFNEINKKINNREINKIRLLMILVAFFIFWDSCFRDPHFAQRF